MFRSASIDHYVRAAITAGINYTDGDRGRVRDVVGRTAEVVRGVEFGDPSS